MKESLGSLAAKAADFDQTVAGICVLMPQFSAKGTERPLTAKPGT